MENRNNNEHNRYNPAEDTPTTETRVFQSQSGTPADNYPYPQHDGFAAPDAAQFPPEKSDPLRDKIEELRIRIFRDPVPAGFAKETEEKLRFMEHALDQAPNIDPDEEAHMRNQISVDLAALDEQVTKREQGDDVPEDKTNHWMVAGIAVASIVALIALVVSIAHTRTNDAETPATVTSVAEEPEAAPEQPAEVQPGTQTPEDTPDNNDNSGGVLPDWIVIPDFGSGNNSDNSEQNAEQGEDSNPGLGDIINPGISPGLAEKIAALAGYDNVTFVDETGAEISKDDADAQDLHVGSVDKGDDGQLSITLEK